MEERSVATLRSSSPPMHSLHFPALLTRVCGGKCSVYGGTFDFLSVLPVPVIQEVVKGQYEMRKDGNRG